MAPRHGHGHQAAAPLASPRGSMPAPEVPSRSGSSPPGRPLSPWSDRGSLDRESEPLWADGCNAPTTAAALPPRSAGSMPAACSGCRCGAAPRWVGTPGLRQPGAHRTVRGRSGRPGPPGTRFRWRRPSGRWPPWAAGWCPFAPPARSCACHQAAPATNRDQPPW
jgi:hypothetical protein